MMRIFLVAAALFGFVPAAGAQSFFDDQAFQAVRDAMRKIADAKSTAVDQAPVDELFQRLTSDPFTTKIEGLEYELKNGESERQTIEVEEHACQAQRGPIVNGVYYRCFGALTATEVRRIPQKNGDFLLETWTFTIDAARSRLIGAKRETVVGHRKKHDWGDSWVMIDAEKIEEQKSVKDPDVLKRWNKLVPKLAWVYPSAEA